MQGLEDFHKAWLEIHPDIPRPNEPQKPAAYAHPLAVVGPFVEQDVVPTVRDGTSGPAGHARGSRQSLTCTSTRTRTKTRACTYPNALRSWKYGLKIRGGEAEDYEPRA